MEDPADLQAHIVAALLGSRPLFTLLQFFHFKDAVNIGKYRLYFCNLPYEKIGKNEPVCIADEVPFDIPESWEWVRLQNICNIVSARRVHQSDWKSSGIPFYRAREIGVLADKGKVDNDLFVSEELYNDFAKSGVPHPGDLMVTAVGTLGKVYVVQPQDRFYYKDASVICLENFGRIIPEYLQLVMMSPYMTSLIKSKSMGTTVGTITIVCAKQYLIPVPPLNEQRKIIKRLGNMKLLIESYAEEESALSKLNTQFPEILKKSILQYAVQGKLVPQDPADEPASALLEHIRAEKEQLIKEGKIKRDKHESVIFRRDNSYYEKVDGIERCIDDELPFEIPESWRWTRWGTVATSIQYGYNAPAKQYGRIRMVRISDIHENLVIWNTVPFCDIDESDISTYLLRPNDILFARTGGTVGKSFLVRDVPYKAIYAGYLIRTRYSTLLCPQYLKHFMESPLYWQQLKTGTTATAQPNCNGQTLSNMLLPLPPAKEQYRIVEKINRAFVTVK